MTGDTPPETAVCANDSAPRVDRTAGGGRGADEGQTAGHYRTAGSTPAAGDDRGQAEQLDFLNGMVILLFGVGLFFAGGSVLYNIGVDSSPDRAGAALNADQRLVEDLLVEDIEDTELDRACADAYFGMDETGICTRVDSIVDGSESEQQWLRYSLGLEDELHVNVTVLEGGIDGDIVTSPGGVAYALGPSPPPDVAVFESNRFVTFGDGEYYTVFVRVW